MVNWRAVIIGFVVEVVLGVVGLAVPVLGQAAAAVIGGGVAGYIANRGILSGGWHGLLAGAFGGIVLGVVLGLAVTLVGIGLTGPGGVVAGASVFFTVVIIALVVSIPSGLGGLLGGALA